MTTDPGTRFDSTKRFATRADAYARARPGYPDALVTTLAGELSLPKQARIADLGCGTGLSCAPFLRAGYRVVGVEPNEAMRMHATAFLGGEAGFSIVDGRSEATGLEAGSVDFVIAAQAFHWFDVGATRREALRILRRPPNAALIWNDRRTEGSDFSRDYENLLLEFGIDYVEIRDRHASTERVRDFFGHENWRTRILHHGDELDFAALKDRLESSSYVPAKGTPQHAPMIERLQELFARTARNGVVSMEFDMRALVGEIAS